MQLKTHVPSLIGVHTYNDKTETLSSFNTYTESHKMASFSQGFKDSWWTHPFNRAIIPNSLLRRFSTHSALLDFRRIYLATSLTFPGIAVTCGDEHPDKGLPKFGESNGEIGIGPSNE